jgi:serine/threonine protein phosphatase PrpC
MTTATALSLRDAPIETSALQGGRAYQQDAATWLRATDPATGRPFMVAAVADGMGSGKDSDLIANDAVFLAATITSAYGSERPDAAIRAAREVIAVQHEDRGGNDNSTLILATYDGSALRVAWVGDSRAYAFTSRGRLVPLTRDHNRAPYRPNVLTRTLLGELDHRCGSSDDCTGHTPESAVFEPTPETGPLERILLCTDGVCGVLSDGEIAEVLRGASNANRAAKRLTGSAVRAATARGVEQPDNATALVIDLADFRAQANR